MISFPTENDWSRMSTVGAGAVRSGWLTKKAEKLGRSKKRYFSLVPSQVSWCKHMHFKLTTATLLLISTFFFPSLHVLCFFFQHTRPLLQQFTQRDAADWSRLRVAGVCLSSMCTGREQQYTQTFINESTHLLFRFHPRKTVHIYIPFFLRRVRCITTTKVTMTRGLHQR